MPKRENEIQVRGWFGNRLNLASCADCPQCTWSRPAAPYPDSMRPLLYSSPMAASASSSSMKKFSHFQLMSTSRLPTSRASVTGAHHVTYHMVYR